MHSFVYYSRPGKVMLYWVLDSPTGVKAMHVKNPLFYGHWHWLVRHRKKHFPLLSSFNFKIRERGVESHSLIGRSGKAHHLRIVLPAYPS